MDASSVYPGRAVDVEGIVSRPDDPDADQPEAPHYEGRVVDTVQGSQGPLVILQNDSGEVQFVPQSDLYAALEAAPEEKADALEGLTPAERQAVERVREQQFGQPAPAQSSQPESAPPSGIGTDVPPETANVVEKDN